MNKLLLYLFTAIMSINIVSTSLVQQVTDGKEIPDSFDFVSKVEEIQQSMMKDTRKPVMEISVSGAVVTVRATDETKLHETAYSFDGGHVWQADNTYTASADKTFPIGSICVRDAAHNKTYNIMPVTVKAEKEKPQEPEKKPEPETEKKPEPVIDSVKPQILSLDVKDKTITVNGKDDVALHTEAYSFDGGETWQSSNTFTVKEDTVFETGTICLRDAAGNQVSNLQRVAVPQRDITAPVITTVKTEKKTVTVEASDETALHAEAYSFDGGKTWQKENSFTVEEKRIFAKDEIAVRDAAGNTTVLGYKLEVPRPDTVAPSMEITVKDNVITITAEDNDELHAEPYSFDGGKAWQSENIYTVKEGRERFAIGQICVRDASGNTARNEKEVIAPEPDKIPPVIEKVETKDTLITVTASDNELLHGTAAYTFDGGNTWQSENTFTVTETHTFKVGEIGVRDANENKTYWDKEVTAEVPDTTVPEFIEISVEKDTLTVLAKDDRALADEAYSFDGGTAWQKNNTYKADETCTFKAGDIVIRDAAGNQTKSTEDYTITIDKKAPTMSVRVEDETLIVDAKDDIALHDTAYSFDGGKTWHKQNTYKPTETCTFAAGSVQVRDAADNTAQNSEEITVKVKDIIPPSMEISVAGAVVTVKASDNVALHAEAYSFDGGTTWQKENTFRPADSHEFAPGEIRVRDAEGNVAKNESKVSVFVPDTTVPVIEKIEVAEDGTVTVTAADNRALHEMAYRFGDSAHWQIGNSYKPVDSMTFEKETIWVRDAAGNIAKNTEPVSVEVPDTTPPVMTIEIKDGVLTVTATDKKGTKEGKLADEPYSFDGGKTWQKENTYAPEKTIVLGSETVRVRDAAGNETFNHGEIRVTVPDRMTPTMSVSVNKDTVVVSAKDNEKLAEEAYSFDGGKTWQKENTFKAAEDTVFAAGEIVVRDAAGNTSSNTEDVSVVLPDKTAPIIVKIEVNDKTLTVTAIDKKGEKTGKLAEEAYSFDGGKTWQKENAYVHEGEEQKTFTAGDIVVRDAAGNKTVSSWNGKVPSKEKDKTAPDITAVTVKDGVITVEASDNEALHSEAYSFDGGDTWQEKNTVQMTEDIVLAKGDVVVRDAAFNMQAWEKEVSVVLPDKTVPEILDITVKGETITVKAEDKKGDKPGRLAEEAYSFDGGKTWQKENSFTPEDTCTFQKGWIVVRDAAGNEAESQKEYTVTVPDTTKPEIISIDVKDGVLTVTAQDKKGNKKGKLAEKAYSFDGGNTWQAENTFAPADTRTFQKGEIVVRDAAGNKASNTSDITVNVPDTEAPSMEIVLGKDSVTVNASDNKPLPEKPYSFDGGNSWTANATFTVKRDTTFQANRIVVRDAAGNTTKNSEDVILVLPDETAPEILSILADNGKVTVKAVDKKGDEEGKLADEAYSFDKGVHWQSSNEYVLQESYTFETGEIMVRDAAGNTVSNQNEISVIVKIPDNTAPTMKIEVKDGAVTVTAEDETALHSEAYSFDGGKTWQKDNVYTAKEDCSFEPKEIVVRDAAGNMAYNQERIEVVIPDNEAPEILEITVAEDTVKVEATDKKLADEPYSFDGGKTWQKENTFAVKENTVFAPGSIWVKDAAGNIAKNEAEVRVELSDKTAPRIVKFYVEPGKITVTAEDDVALHDTAYSFDGGLTWQKVNSFTVTENTVFQVGDIMVRDAAGNKAWNTSVQIVYVPRTFQKGSLMLDVSSHQGNIDWNQVKAAGYDYVILRALTFSGLDYSLPADIPDPYFKTNLRGAKAAGLKVGAYIYTYAFNQNEAIYEIDVFDNLMKEMKAEGYSLDLPVFIDHEYEKLPANTGSVEYRTNLLRFQMDTLRQRGYYSAMYMSTNWAQNVVNAEQLQREGYDLWIADYRGVNGYNSSVDIVAWQYSNNARVPGIRGAVDVSYLYKDYSNIITGSNNNGQVSEAVPTYMVYDLNSRQRTYLTMDEIVEGIVGNEVGSIRLTGADRANLFRAQAIAARSWVLYNLEENGRVPRVGLKFEIKDEKGKEINIKTIIAPVLNKRLTYEGRTANTVYGAASGPVTNSAKDYWGNADVPYLRSVESSREKYYTKKYQPREIKRSTEQVKSDLQKLDVEVTGSPDTWIRITSRNEQTGYVTGLEVCGKKISVSAFNETVYGPTSPNFTYTYKNGAFTFTSYGFGHCVGMSQLGATGYIGVDQWSYDQVLAHYYPGTKLENY